MTPEVMVRWRSFCGIFWIVTSRPLALKMPASLASVSGAKPVHPEMPMATLVSCACAAAAAASTPQATRARITKRLDLDIGNSLALVSPMRAAQSMPRRARQGIALFQLDIQLLQQRREEGL